MKIEKINQKLHNGDEPALKIALLSHRIGDELCAMATMCKNVENALGAVIGSPENPVSQSIMAIQGLDRLRQTLEDLARLSRHIARAQSCSNEKISAHEICSTVVLVGLAERLSKSDTAQLDKNFEGPDEIWL